ncbi:MAG: MAC/perforin domain-containing protein [Victivallaceae bacterium]
MHLLSESFQVNKIKVFDQTIYDSLATEKTASHKENEKIFSSFISNLKVEDFSIQVNIPTCSNIEASDQLPNILSPEDYQLICSCEDDLGYHYQVLEPVFLTPVAYCIVQKSLISSSLDLDLIDELKTCLINSSQDGCVYQITTPMLMSGENNASNASYELIKNVGFLGKALNIVTLDPINLVSSLSSINALDYSFTEETAILSSDARYGIPPGTKLEPRFTSSVNIDSSIFEEKTSFSNTFSATVSINIPLPLISSAVKGTGAVAVACNSAPNGEEAATEKAATASAFSASYSYEFIQERTRESKNVVTHTTATRSLYVLKQDISYDPKLIRLDNEFRYWIEQKLDPSNPANLEQFIKMVGTHYITSVMYGGIGFQVLTISAETVTELKEKKISISAAAADALLSSTASSDSTNTYFSFESKMSAKTAFLGGTVLPEIGPNHQLLFKDWAESVPQEPVPLQVKVALLTDLLTPAAFPNMDVDKLNNLKSALLNAIKEYLKAHIPAKIPEKKIFTASYYYGAANNSFILEAAYAPLRVSAPYQADWSLISYDFPTLREISGSSPFTLFFSLNGRDVSQKIVHNGSYYLGSYISHQPSYGIYSDQDDCLSFFGGWPQAYLGTLNDSRSLWTVEKLNTTQDLFVRDGDQIRLKHVYSAKYLATTAMRDGLQTLTRTTDPKDAVFTIKDASDV